MRARLFIACHLLAGCVSIAGADEPISQPQIVQGKTPYKSTFFPDLEFFSATEACKHHVQNKVPGYQYKSALETPEGYVECFWKNADGTYSQQGFITHELICPQYSSKQSKDGTNLFASLRCECEYNMVSTGTACVSPDSPEGKQALNSQATDTPSNDSGNPSKPADPENCKKTKRKAPAGGADIANQFCAWVSRNSPSYNITFEGKVNEIDALRGNTWMECKCGYLSTARAAKSGYGWGLGHFSGLGQRRGENAHEPGMDREIERQKKIAKACGMEYGIWVSHEEVGEYFRKQYPGVKIYVDTSWPMGGRCN